MADDLRRLSRAIRQQADALKVWGIRELPIPRPLAVSSGREIPSISEGFRQLEQEVIACRRCPLYRTRTRHVFGEGSPDARLVFIGEAPGREEDLQGRPFVGAAGQLLTKMIEAMGLRREEVYICNVLKDRPPGNRTPELAEVDACLGFLERQLALIRPRVVCALGAVAARALLGPHVAITKVRGAVLDYQGIPLVPTFHPAYLLRNPDAKKVVWQDLKKVKRLLDESP
ncbi:MAG: uracil-DNA glycosylase [Candidatus Omnitrophica bacterium]|nr:uracil-DNA glycosylase [Candidatus Omnitrophota bacterium]